jgi:hypothetical protein
MTTGCRCNDADTFHGEEAERYAREHLVTDEVRTEALEEDLSCPDTGARWRLDFPDRTQREPGQARLRRI